jgi:hypothetical protein
MRIWQSEPESDIPTMGCPAAGAHSARTCLPVDLNEHWNNVAFTTPSTLGLGGLNVWGNSLPAGTLPAGRATIGGLPFLLAAADGRNPDNVRCAGQFIALPHVRADWIHLVAAAERRCEEHVHLHFATGATDPEWLRVSDFWPAAAHFGELLAARTEAMHYPHHVQRGLGGQIWLVRVPVTRRETLTGMRLPDNPAMHVFGLTLEVVG